MTPLTPFSITTIVTFSKRKKPKHADTVTTTLAMQSERIPKRTNDEVEEVSLIGNISSTSREGLVHFYNHKDGHGRINVPDGSSIVFERHGLKTDVVSRKLRPSVQVSFTLDYIQRWRENRAIDVDVVPVAPFILEENKRKSKQFFDALLAKKRKMIAEYNNRNLIGCIMNE
jgi:hypothetical protein